MTFEELLDQAVRILDPAQQPPVLVRHRCHLLGAEADGALHHGMRVLDDQKQPPTGVENSIVSPIFSRSRLAKGLP